jgi:hypothetical protein
MATIDIFATAFTDLDDTPGSITADEFVKANVGGTALEFFDLFGTANAWTADQTFSANILAGADQTYNIGSAANRFNEVRGKQGLFTSSYPGYNS